MFRLKPRQKLPACNEGKERAAAGISQALAALFAGRAPVIRSLARAASAIAHVAAVIASRAVAAAPTTESSGAGEGGRAKQTEAGRENGQRCRFNGL